MKIRYLLYRWGLASCLIKKADYKLGNITIKTKMEWLLASFITRRMK